MRKPSALTPWLTTGQMLDWVKAAPDKAAYQRRLAIRLTHLESFPAHRVADILTVSTQAVWKWLGEYNTLGPGGLDRKGRGGRRRALMTLEEEQAFLAKYFALPDSGTPKSSKQLHKTLCRVLRKDVSMDYVYRLIRRHKGRS